MAPGAVSGGETHAPRKTEVAATVARTEPPAARPKRQRSSVASVRAKLALSVRRVPPSAGPESGPTRRVAEAEGEEGPEPPVAPEPASPEPT